MKKDPSNKDSGFKLPEDYFSNLEERIRERLEQQETEATLPQEAGFTVPEGYFENLSDHILQQVNTSHSKPDATQKTTPETAPETTSKARPEVASELSPQGRPKSSPTRGVIPLNRGFWKYAVAATITVLIATSTWMIQKNNQSITFDDLSFTDIEWLLDQGALDIPQQFLIEEANDTLLMELSMAENMLDEQLLENYLSEEADLYELMD